MASRHSGAAIGCRRRLTSSRGISSGCAAPRCSEEVAVASKSGKRASPDRTRPVPARAREPDVAAAIGGDGAVAGSRLQGAPIDPLGPRIPAKKSPPWGAGRLPPGRHRTWSRPAPQRSRPDRPTWAHSMAPAPDPTATRHTRAARYANALGRTRSDGRITAEHRGRRNSGLRSDAWPLRSVVFVDVECRAGA
jgi:hypothetical protein